MKRRSGFVALVEDLLEPLGGVSVRRMFGGHGVFKDGVMFALIAGDRLYLKSDEQTLARFEAEGLEAFVYEKRGRAVRMSYHRAPDESFDEPDVLLDWVDDALAAARRQRRSKERRPA